MIMKKKLFFAVVAIGLLASCVDNEYVGEVTPNPNPGNGTESAIVFSSGTKALTRGDKTGESAATELNNNFVFEGTKKTSTADFSPVFNDYQANYVANTANTTQSNSNDWEYVGYYNVPGGVTTTAGVVDFAPTADNTSKVTQSIKYWDYATTQYDFAAYSLGKGNTTTTTGANPTTSTTYATASAIDVAKAGSTTAGDFVYSLTGTVDQLKTCYISDLETAYNRDGVSDYGNVVTFKFRSLATKIRLAFYETVPGYSVKDVKFYSIDEQVEDANSPSTPLETMTLFTATKVLPAGEGTMKITFPTIGWANSGNQSGTNKHADYNKAHVSFTQTDANDATSTLTFGALNNYATSTEGELAAGSPYIGRASNDASYAGGLDNGTGKYYTILPSGSGNNLQIRIKYTLVSTDNSNETIDVDNATAVIPAELAQWEPNYAYTYIFKISDMTNGSTGTDGSGNIQYGLTPITLNAVVVDSEDGVQETITTVSEPSITTYAQGKVVTVNDEYVADIPIYVIVNDGTSNVTLSSTNAKLFTATATNAIQGITEETVGNAFRYGIEGTSNGKTTYTVTDAKAGTLVLTEATPSSNWLVTEIAATDSPTGNKIDMDGTNTKAAKFTPSASTVYVFQYLTNESAKVDPVYAAVTAPSSPKLTAGTTYYRSTSDATGFEATGHEVIYNVLYTKDGNVYTRFTGTTLTAGTNYYISETDNTGFTAAEGDFIANCTYYTKDGTTYQAIGYLDARQTYYTSEKGAGKFIAVGSEIVTADTYWTCTNAASVVEGKYQYKIIKVQ